MLRTALLSLCAVAAAFAGYGGFGIGWSCTSLHGLSGLLTRLNQEGLQGQDSLRLRGPLWSVFGQGGGLAGPLSVAGTGSALARLAKADRLKYEMVAATGALELGYPYQARDWLVLKPCVDLGGAGWAGFAHSLDRSIFPWAMDADFSRYVLGWVAGLAPGAEVMGRLRTGRTSSLALYAKAAWFIPVMAAMQYGNTEDPGFNLSGFSLSVGLRFGRLAERPFHM